MKETVALDKAQARMRLAEAMADARAATFDLIQSRSMIVWGEHCSECAAPTCYTACSFYTPRPDGHCRRFAHGIETIDAGSAHQTPLTRIAFRRWGKLEGRGPVGALSKAEVAALEQAQKPALGLGLAFVARREARARTAQHQALGQKASGEFDAFLIEGAALSAETISFTLTFVPVDKTSPALFQSQFSLRADWTRVSIPVADIARIIDLSKDYLVQIEPVGEAEGLEVLLGLCDFVTWAGATQATTPSAPPKAPAAKAKVVVWDLDHTIWDGILLEDGPEGVVVKPGIREMIEALDARGILQSIASKNNHDEAIAALAHHGLLEFMLAPQISWGPKSAALTRIAETLSLGLDSFVFIDDQPFERGEVGEAHPCVTVLADTEALTLLDRPQFDVPVTAESKGRRALYAVEAQRALAAESAAGDMDQFLRSCDLVLTLAPLSPEDAERVYELSQRTNQLNIAATRYSRDDVAAMMSDPSGGEAWTLRCADRFGDYGLIGFAYGNPITGQIRDFFMSCRVQRKRVEAAFFSWLAARYSAAGAEALSISYQKAARNGPALDLFLGLGFTLDAADASHGQLRKDLPADFEGSDIVRIHLPSLEPLPARTTEAV
jgi:FkbH-like protein